MGGAVIPVVEKLIDQYAGHRAAGKSQRATVEQVPIAEQSPPERRYLTGEEDGGGYQSPAQPLAGSRQRVPASGLPQSTLSRLPQRLAGP